MVDNTKIFCELSIQYIDRKIKLIFLKDNIKNYRIKEEKKKRDGKNRIENTEKRRKENYKCSNIPQIMIF